MSETATSGIGIDGTTGVITTSGLEALAMQNVEVGAESTLAFNEDMIKVLLHDVRTPWTVVLGFLDLAKGDDSRYEPIWEAAKEFYNQIETLMENYFKSALVVGINGSIFTEDIQDLQVRLTKLGRNVQKYDRKTDKNVYSLLENSFGQISDKLNQITKISNKYGEFKIEKEEFSVEEAIGDAKKEVYNLAAQKKISILVTNDYKGNICTNQTAFTSLIENYLSNAIKYSEPGKEVTVNVYQNEERIMIEVSDNGIGMTEEEQSKAFEMGYMAPMDLAELHRLDLHTNNRRGLGLGLTKQIAERLGGRVSVKSQKGRGSIFYLEMPIGIKDRKDRRQSADVANVNPEPMAVDYAA